MLRPAFIRVPWGTLKPLPLAASMLRRMFGVARLGQLVVLCGSVLLASVVAGGGAVAGTDRETFLSSFTRPDLGIVARGVVQASDGGYVVSGWLFNDSGPSNWAWVVKVDPRGQKQWEKELGRSARDAALTRLVAMPDRNIVLVGNIGARPGGPLESGSGWIVKLDERGDLIWERTLELATVTHVLDAKVTPAGDVAVSGRLRQAGGDSGFVGALDTSGKWLWKSVVKGVWIDVNTPLRGGGMVVAGSRRASLHSATPVWVARLDDKGKVLWEHQIRKGTGVLATAIVELEDGSVLVAVEAPAGSGGHATLLRFSSAGQQEWQLRLAHPVSCGIASLWIIGPSLVGGGGRTCDGAGHRGWAATFSPPKQEPSTVRRFLSGKGFGPAYIAPTKDMGFVAVGSNSATGERPATSWIYKGRF